MRWFIGIDDGEIVLEGGCLHGVTVVSAPFAPDQFMQGRAFSSEWMLSDPKNVILFRSSFDHPEDNGCEPGFNPHDWMLQVCARAV